MTEGEDDLARTLICRVIIGAVLILLWVIAGLMLGSHPHFPSYWMSPLLGFYVFTMPSEINSTIIYEIVLPWLGFWFSFLFPIFLPTKYVQKIFRHE